LPIVSGGRDAAGCARGEWEVCGDARGEPRFRSGGGITATTSRLVVSDSGSRECGLVAVVTPPDRCSR